MDKLRTSLLGWFVVNSAYKPIGATQENIACCALGSIGIWITFLPRILCSTVEQARKIRALWVSYVMPT